MVRISDNLRIGVRSVTQDDQQRLANLIHFEYHIHRHLDWISPLDLLESQPFLAVEQDDVVQAALACPIEPPGVAWIRLFTASESASFDAMWNLLWMDARKQILELGGARVVAIALQKWFASLLERNKFNRIQDVVFLTWDGPQILEEPSLSRIKIRLMEESDLDQVYQVDKASFAPIWHNSLASLKAAFCQSYLSSVAVDGNEIIGYQISTVGHLGGHLARLAVHPTYQGRKIGYLLLYNLLQEFQARGKSKISVNTQQDNIISLNLYKKAGFRQTGEIYGVYEYICLPFDK